MSFRSKLLLALMAVVGGVTGAVLLAAQRQLAVAHERLFEQQFQSQQALLRAGQESRLKQFQDKCYTFSKLVRLHALMRRWAGAADSQDQADMAVTGERLYKTANDELREVLDRSQAEPGAQVASILRIIGSKGETIPPPESVSAGEVRLSREADQHLASRLADISKAGRTLAEIRAGHLAVETLGGHPLLLEVILYPFIDPNGGDLLGGLVVGFASPEGASRSVARSPDEPVRGGIFLDGELYSSTLPTSLKPILAAKIAGPPRSDATFGRQVDVPFDGQPYRVFFASLNSGAGFPRSWRVSAFPLREVLAEEAALRWRIGAYGFAALAAAAILSALLAHGLSVPIRQLAAATAEVERGHLEVRVPVTSGNELGRLAGAFNQMVAGLAQRERFRSLLNLVTDKGIAEELIAGRVALGGERRDISVLFCDIRGFTALTQNMAPEEVVRMLNEHFTPLTRVVYEHNGVVDKFVGDLIMAIFGAPKIFGHDALNAVQCALRMIAERQSLNSTSRHRIQMGIGIASGPVLAGCMGSNDRLNYTVVGERVNLASRLCGQAGKMEVVIDQTTRERLGEAAIVQTLPPVTLKGFDQPVQSFKLLSIVDARNAGKPVLAVTAPGVG